MGTLPRRGSPWAGFQVITKQACMYFTDYVFSSLKETFEIYARNLGLGSKWSKPVLWKCFMCRTKRN